MYQLIGGTKALLGGYATLAAFIAVAFALRAPHAAPAAWYEAADWYDAAARGASIAAFLLWLFGQTALFPIICRVWPIGLVIPDIDGPWSGKTSSNWPRIQTRGSVDPNTSMELPLQDVPVEVRIKARLLNVIVTLVSENRYSESETLCVRMRRDHETGSDQIVYVYKNRTRNPKPTDEQFHMGGGCLDIVRHRRTIELLGVYWTNRNWQRGINTAGTITLKKKAIKPHSWYGDRRPPL
jgi:hypothetical protein